MTTQRSSAASLLLAQVVKSSLHEETSRSEESKQSEKAAGLGYGGHGELCQGKRTTPRQENGTNKATEDPHYTSYLNCFGAWQE